MNKVIILLVILIVAMISIVAGPVPASVNRTMMHENSLRATNQSVYEHREELSEMVMKNRYLIVLMKAYVVVLLTVFFNIVVKPVRFGVIIQSCVRKINAHLQFYRALISFFTGLGWR